MAQYPGNGNQKITLGEQTTADGLVFRGVANDTNVITPFSDTSAYIILDTVNSKFYHYNRTTTYWALAGGGVSVTSFSAGSTGLTPSTATTGAVTLGGTLAVANGGTGANMASLPNNYLIRKNSSGIFDTAAVFELDGKVGIGTATPNAKLSITNGNSFTNFSEVVGATNYSGFNFSNTSAEITLSNYNMISNGASFFLNRPSGNDVAIREANASQMIIKTGGEVWIGYTSDQGLYKLQINGQIFATNATIATSDEKYKENITPLNKGLEIVNKLKPVTFNFISNTENNFSEYEEVGFIAQDVDRALSTETFAKSIVKAADDSEPTSTMGLATQNLIPILVKAIQEQQALIKTLEQRLLILENK
jgi:hypothetical protein